MDRIIITAWVVLFAAGLAEAQGFGAVSFTGADNKLVDAARKSMEAHPDAYFYITFNAESQQVLRSAREPLLQPIGRHPERRPPARDIVLGAFGGRPSLGAVTYLQSLCTLSAA